MSQNNFSEPVSEPENNSFAGSKAKDQPAGAGRFPAFRRLWKKTRRGLLIAVLLFAVAHASLNTYASVLLNRELGEIQQKNEPLRVIDLAPLDVPASENAALIYQQAVAALQLSNTEEELLANALKPQSAPDHTARVALSVALKRNQKAIQLARRAAFQPKCRFPVDWGGPAPEILLPHYALVRKLARLLAAQSLESARTGDTKGALRDVQAIFRMSQHIQQEPLLIGFLVARAINASAFDTLAQVLEISPISAAQGHSFLASLPPADWNAAYRRGLIGERTFTLWGFNTLRSDWRQFQRGLGNQEVPGAMRWVARPFILLWMPFLKLDEVYALRAWKQKLSAPVEVPAPAGSSESDNRIIENSPRYAILTRLLFPAIGGFHDQRDSIEVSERQMTIALGLSAYRVAHRHYPTRLKEIEALWGQTLPLDPYSKQPFIYRSDGKTFMVYSIGANRVDQKGQRRSNRSPQTGQRALFSDDLVWKSASR